jgi:hypothetical protein
MTARTAPVALSLQAEPTAPQTIPGSLHQHHLRQQQQQLHQQQISSTSSALSEGLGGWDPSTQSSISKSPSAADVFRDATDAECDYQTEESSEGSDFGKYVPMSRDEPEGILHRKFAVANMLCCVCVTRIEAWRNPASDL